MVKEAYVSFEIAKLLRNKDFDEEVGSYYDMGGQGYFVSSPRRCNVGNGSVWAAPTHQMTLAWLREKHNIHISVTIGADVDNPNYIFYWAGIAKFDNKSVSYIDPFGEEEFNSNEEAVEVAIKYCLENLI